MTRQPQRSAQTVLIAAMLVLGFAAPIAARDNPDDDDRREQQDQRRGKARANAGQQPGEAPAPPQLERRQQPMDRHDNAQRGDGERVRQHAERRESIERQRAERGGGQDANDAWRRAQIDRHQVETRGERIRGDDEQRLRMQQRNAREQAARRSSLAREQAERRDDAVRRRQQVAIQDELEQTRPSRDRRQAERRGEDSQRVEDGAADGDEDAARQRHDRQQRLSGQQQRRLIEQQRQRAQAYRQRIDAEQALARQRAYTLQQQQRMAQYRYQQDYYQRLYRQQSQWASQRHDYYNDPFFYTPANYRYSFGGQRYETNRYGADLLRNAVRQGYREGLRAGRADRMDGWRPDYRSAYAYQDANYGYNGYYVRQDAYNYYFRQGFRRGYQDGYQSRYRYGSYNNGSASILPAVLSVILGLQLFN